MAAGVQRVGQETNMELIDWVYVMGYMEAVEHERKRKRELREKREKKKYFLIQKSCGFFMLILTVAAVKILAGDATIALLTVPLGMVLLTSKEMIIVNQYYWKCEDEKCNL